MCINEVGRFEMVKELFWMPSTLFGPLNWEASRPGTVTILQFHFIYLFIRTIVKKMSDEDATPLNPRILAETNLLSFRNVFCKDMQKFESKKYCLLSRGGAEQFLWIAR